MWNFMSLEGFSMPGEKDMDKKIVEDFSAALEKIDDGACSAYQDKMNIMVDRVNQVMLSRRDLNDLIGSNPKEVMLQNHGNHARFMTSQFCIKSPETFIRITAWVYHTYIARGFSPRYFLVELRQWQKAVEHYLDPKSAELINAFYQVMIDHHENVLELSRKIVKPEDVPEHVSPLMREYLQAILEPDTVKALQMVREYVTSSDKIKPWCEEVIRPAMYELGRLWAIGEITVGEEHLATSITQRVIASYYPLILDYPRDKGAVMVSASPGEYHEIGPRILADLMELNGWNVYYSGADTPADSIVRFLHKNRPKHICISTTLTSNLIYVVNLVKNIRDIGATEVIVGGQAYMADPRLWEKVGADNYFENADSLLKHINK